MFKWKTALKAISYDDFHKQNAERRQGLSLIVKKLVIILWGFLMGGLLNFINVPAGWLKEMLMIKGNKRFFKEIKKSIFISR